MAHMFFLARGRKVLLVVLSARLLETHTLLLLKTAHMLLLLLLLKRLQGPRYGIVARPGGFHDR